MKNYGSRIEVFQNDAKQTRGGLTKKDLILKGDKLITQKEINRNKKNINKMEQLRDVKEKKTPKKKAKGSAMPKGIYNKNDDDQLREILKHSNYNITGKEINQLKTLYGNGIISEILGSIGLGLRVKKIKGGDFSSFMDGLQKVITTGLTIAPLVAKFI